MEDKIVLDAKDIGLYADVLRCIRIYPRINHYHLKQILHIKKPLRPITKMMRRCNLVFGTGRGELTYVGPAKTPDEKMLRTMDLPWCPIDEDMRDLTIAHMKEKVRLNSHDKKGCSR